jgi:DNA-binding response OmpR family regulator
MSRVLIVDDDTGLLQSLDRLLRREGFIPTTIPHAHGALKAMESDNDAFDCVLLDVSMAGMDGLTCCRRIREFSYVPIILVSARGDSIDRILGLEIGADDYVTKPFNPRELVARIHAVIRGRREYSGPRSNRQTIEVDGLKVDTCKREAFVEGKPASLTQREFSILLYLAERSGEAVSRDALFEDIWGYESELGGKSLDVYIRRLRRKIEKDPGRPTIIQTVRGYGYKLAAPEVPDSVRAASAELT